jgi:hypothetical protein
MPARDTPHFVRSFNDGQASVDINIVNDGLTWDAQSVKLREKATGGVGSGPEMSL